MAALSLTVGCHGVLRRRILAVTSRTTVVRLLLLGALAGACGLGELGEPTLPVPDSEQICDATSTPDVGFAPLRRLTREQYDHAVRDLLQVANKYGTALSADERIGPFAGNTTTPVSRTVVEQFIESAERVAADVDVMAIAPPCDRLAIQPAECAQRFVTRVGLRAYRRPLAQAEIDGLMRVYADHAVGDHTNGLRMVVQAMLQSPNFLYHLEATEPGASGTLVPLDGWSIASRLSFFLWSSIPDEPLLAAAEAGELADAAGIEAQVVRMLDDPRAADAMASFHLQVARPPRSG